MRTQEERDRDFSYKCKVCKDSGAVVVPLSSSMSNGSMVRPGTGAVKCDMCELGDLRYAALRSYSAHAAGMGGIDPLAAYEEYLAQQRGVAS